MNRSPTSLVFLCAAVLALLSACGFQPLYGDRTTNSQTTPTDDPLKDVRIVLIEDREGQILRNFLIDRFQPTGSNLYTLQTKLNIDEQDLGIASDSTTTRSRVVVTARFTLSYGERTHEFASRSAGSFSTVQSDYGTLVARQDATRRSLREIADEAKIRIGAFLRRLNGI